ncbi:competence/damage-inducible protein A [Paraliomyxa miuraensis]|uniref:competence/damage-inducible protein A n=1 Tax=Paraliomyxa miuraensis TaxID=376150 RepID=UPI002254F1C6|nr:competence/damage-inducible protein A [Paraliomyxa miuraensis]MCX4245877.1 competence/damage-inducible protein A [Paraliomyxa miuraensis]
MTSPSSAPTVTASGSAAAAGSAAPRAAVLLIGDELLSGKIRDENGWFLAKMMRRRGIALVEIRTVGDGIEDIGRALLELLARVPLVFTSGGVGPTHDDRTLEAIARATGHPLMRHPEIEAELRAHYGSGLTPEALSMADVPEGTVLRAGPGWPVMRLDLQAPQPARVYVLPGVPPLLRTKIERLEALPDELPQGEGWHLATLHSTLEEHRLAPLLDAVLERHPGVEIGSYPRWTREDDGQVRYHVRVTFEAPMAAAAVVQAARDALRASLPEGTLLPDPDPTVVSA